MLAVIAAIIFGLGFLLDLVGARIPGGFSGMTFVLLGLTLLALHQAGVGTASIRTGYSNWRGGRARR
ncbi:unnamed protein product [[Actinomadura] parvosata subsp. kistnae]|uniref:Uncharacterized protein n=2 Tax=Nonomuraea TaxID=83681 RepID=A0A1V0A369_9ACTN|nr:MULTISPECIES: hypothetical protein [unclassified Nonomuraea]AQZ64655.1 hypothetical protein BKM31_27185 [Nonomuraea sp. ATCC 55076]NJP87946.1 hypothetical protein [Nonomuraea sp. FMUSA5-5]SPL98616.1 unnamed protein product [Actinomadura parvosata subsp. kistnae]